MNLKSVVNSQGLPVTALKESDDVGCRVIMMNSVQAAHDNPNEGRVDVSSHSASPVWFTISYNNHNSRAEQRKVSGVQCSQRKRERRIKGIPKMYKII